MKTYTTVGTSASAEFEEKRSVFIGHACHVSDVDEAMAFVKEKQAAYRDATHNVWAYYMKDGVVARYSDDGEPTGTAGMPTLDTIRKSGVDDTCVVVTRYFGGILLGAGGLVRAYSKAASLAVQAAGIVTYESFSELSVRLTYRLSEDTERAAEVRSTYRRHGFYRLGAPALCREGRGGRRRDQTLFRAYCGTRRTAYHGTQAR